MTYAKQRLRLACAVTCKNSDQPVQLPARLMPVWVRLAVTYNRKLRSAYTSTHKDSDQPGYTYKKTQTSLGIHTQRLRTAWASAHKDSKQPGHPHTKIRTIIDIRLLIVFVVRMKQCVLNFLK